MNLFSSRFSKYLAKYIKLVWQKKQFTRIIKILGKFQSFLLKKPAFIKKIDAVMLMHNVNF